MSVVDVLARSGGAPDAVALVGSARMWTYAELRAAVDERAARARTVLLGYRDVLERYGTPTEIWGERGELNWLYARGRDPVSDAWQEEVWFQFVDGFVVQLGVKQP